MPRVPFSASAVRCSFPVSGNICRNFFRICLPAREQVRFLPIQLPLRSHDPGGSHVADEVRKTMKTDQGFERRAHSSDWVSMP